MAENLRLRFNPSIEPLSAEQIAQHLGLELKGDSGRMFTAMAPLTDAKSDELSFLDNSKYTKHLKSTKAGGVILRASVLDEVPEGVVCFVTDMPYVAFAQALSLFYPPEAKQGYISEKAVVDSTASLGENVSIEAGAVICAEAQIGNNTVVEAGSYIGSKVIIGHNCHIGHSATLKKCVLGDGCILHAGVRIGQDGFGFAYDGKQVIKVPQVGGVRIGNLVEIGANTTIDCGAMGDTVIGDMCKLDNAVQIAHNVELGAGCQIAAQSGVAGSTKLGRGVIMGGNSGVAGHITIADGTMIAGRSGVTKPITEPRSVVSGMPAKPIKQWRRQQVILNRLCQEYDNKRVVKNDAS